MDSPMWARIWVMGSGSSGKGRGLAAAPLP